MTTSEISPVRVWAFLILSYLYVYIDFAGYTDIARGVARMLGFELMENFITWYQTEAMALHPVERAARVHSDFVKIHPFVDGNGRTSRLLMNLELR